MIAVLVAAWINRDEGYLAPDTGVGYWLGIMGSSLMALLLLYPLRKRYRILHGLGHVAHWFRLHMIFGILGPVLIILHSNYKLDSLNSTVALMTMLIVVASGIVGRYLYAAVHRGLYGVATSVREIISEAGEIEHALGSDLDSAGAVVGEIQPLLKLVDAPPRSFLASLWRAATIGLRISRCRRRARRAARVALDTAAALHGWRRAEQRRRRQNIDEHLSLYFASIAKAARFAVFERALAMWHLLHFPLFIALVLTVVVHIVAVHLF